MNSYIQNQNHKITHATKQILFNHMCTCLFVSEQNSPIKLGPAYERTNEGELVVNEIVNVHLLQVSLRVVSNQNNE